MSKKLKFDTTNATSFTKASKKKIEVFLLSAKPCFILNRIQTQRPKKTKIDNPSASNHIYRKDEIDKLTASNNYIPKS